MLCCRARVLSLHSVRVRTLPYERKKMTSGEVPLHDLIKPLSWLLGKWRSEDGFGHYPTIKDFKYGEELEFFHVGQPNIQFSFYAWHAETKKPMHREIGFIRIKPGTNQVALIGAQNTGLAEVEEGHVEGQEMKTETQTMARLSFGTPPAVRKLSRVFKRNGDILEQLLSMETENTPMTSHLKISYQKVK
ncbi:hypothetical protein ACJMK2_017595 [Sinanodonta woodiana]|uniref:THAP4-like heme-binding domain-containing protein n=1 Tax=Sinanodonta woodiana TaxID=1069815 RepID=A0ABD3UB56_SINWO